MLVACDFIIMMQDVHCNIQICIYPSCWYFKWGTGTYCIYLNVALVIIHDVYDVVRCLRRRWRRGLRDRRWQSLWRLSINMMCSVMMRITFYWSLWKYLSHLYAGHCQFHLSADYSNITLHCIIDHPQSCVVYNFEGICLSVCLSVCMSVRW